MALAGNSHVKTMMRGGVLSPFSPISGVSFPFLCQKMGQINFNCGVGGWDTFSVWSNGRDGRPTPRLLLKLIDGALLINLL